MIWEKEADESPLHTLVNLQGKTDCKYQVHFAKGPKPLRKREADVWPSSAEENMERLEDAGFREDRGVGKCRNCERELAMIVICKSIMLSQYAGNRVGT